jgi:DNA-binding transcriptional MerR regulator
VSPRHPKRDDDELLTGRQAARILGIHENTVRNWADAGILAIAEVLPGTRYRRYDPADVKLLKQKMAAKAPGVLTAEQHQTAQQIAEQLHSAALALPPGDHIGMAGSTPHGATFTIERNSHLYSVVVLPQEAGVPQ